MIGITINIKDKKPSDHEFSMVCLTNNSTWCLIDFVERSPQFFDDPFH